MNIWLLLGALVLTGAAVAHSLVGEKVVLRRLYRRVGPRAEEGRRAGDDPSTRRAVRLAWHSVSIALLGYAMLLFTAAFDQAAFGDRWATVAQLLATTFAGLAVLSLVIAKGRHTGWMWYAAAAAMSWLSID